MKKFTMRFWPAKFPRSFWRAHRDARQSPGLTKIHDYCAVLPGTSPSNLSQIGRLAEKTSSDEQFSARLDKNETKRKPRSQKLKQAP
jgi:hypothetical protein